MLKFHPLRACVALAAAFACAGAQILQCPPAAHGLPSRMLDTNIARGDGLVTNASATAMLEAGLFQQALRESIFHTGDNNQIIKWIGYLDKSIWSANDSLANATVDAWEPLNRLAIGLSFLHRYNDTKDTKYLQVIQALQQSVVSQKRNANKGFWYYDNQKKPAAYQNLSYIDGMFSYPPFAIASTKFNFASDNVNFNEAGAFTQLTILEGITGYREDGLLVHGYDALKNHTWADPKTGAAPIVWATGLALYTLGVVNSLELLQNTYSDLIHRYLALFIRIIKPQLAAIDRSSQIGGRYGVWQVVDQPAATFNGHENFIETSSSLLTAYSLLKAARLGLFDASDDSSAQELKVRAQVAGLGIFQSIREKSLIENGNGTLSLNGTSSFATLSGDIDYEFYVQRPLLLNSLIGTSAFILAGLEVEKIC